MADAGHQALTVEEWNGIFARGLDDTTPQGYFLDSLNCKFSEGSAYSRDGSTKILTAANIVRFFVYRRLGETVRYIYLTRTGQLFDSLFPSTPIWTDASFVDFSALNFNNRFYITPHNRVTGIPGKSVLVYDGSGQARIAGSAQPLGFTLTVTAGASGSVEAGVHFIAVCYETASGFLSMPGPAVYGSIVAPGKTTLVVTGLPIGPAGTVARQLVATQSIQTDVYNGNQDGYQFFLIPSANGGIINDNTTTTATVDFFDTDLVADATYLFSTRASIPAGVCIADYNGRMCLGGFNADPHSVYISEPYNPEQMSTLNGYITVDPFQSGQAVSNLFSFRGSLNICKSHRIYQSTDNQSDPNTWPTPLPIDAGTGTECFGVGTILDAKGQQTDRALIADRSGLIVYQGYVTRPEGSWIVENIWKRINKSLFDLIQINVDPETSSIYITLPLDGSPGISHILYGWYGNAYGMYGFDAKQIKWSLWQMVPGISSICIDTDSVTGASMFLYSGTVNGIYKVMNDFSQHVDDTTAFRSMIKTSLYTTKPGWTQHCNLMKLRLQGNGSLLTSLWNQDGTNQISLLNIAMNAAPGFDYELKANYQATRVSAQFITGAGFGEWFRISRMDLYLKPMWQSFPA